MSDQSPVISIVIPIFNEEENLVELSRRLEAVLEGLDISYETIFVDDGSTDHTLDRLMEIRRSYPNTRILSFSRNFGHQVALTAGLEHSKGQAVITMDGDLQHPPELIPELIAHWRASAEIVNTLRQRTEKEPFFKRITSKFFYRFKNLSFYLLNKEAFSLIPHRFSPHIHR